MIPTSSSSSGRHPAIPCGPSAVFVLGLTAALGGPSVAFAQNQAGIDADPEMIRPFFGHGAMPGLDVPDTRKKNALRWGILAQYEYNPVVGYRLGEEVGPIVANRINLYAGFSMDVSKRFTWRLAVPVNAHFGTAFVEDFTDEQGPGLGDISAGARVLFVRSKAFKLGASADLALPTGRDQAFMGDKFVKFSPAVLAMAELGPIDLVGNVGMGLRLGGVDDTGSDFEVGPDFTAAYGIRLDAPWLPIDITHQGVFRGGLTNFFQGGAENSFELIGGVQIPFYKEERELNWKLDIMGGRGTNQGYGTTDFRGLAQVTFDWVRIPKPAPEITEVAPPPPPPPLEEEEEEVVEWTPEVSARINDDQIEIRDPIQFEYNTSNILPVSLHVLQDVADLLNDNGRIDHTVVEGHASEEGTFEFNYRLSTERSQAIYRKLVELGVHPDRVSYRAKGETDPRVAGDSEEALAENRRVEFHIVRQLGEFDEIPSYGGSIKLPWTGEMVEIKQPLTRDQLKARKAAEEARRLREQGAPPKPAPGAEGTLEFQQEKPPVEELQFEDGPAPAPAAPTQPAPATTPTETAPTTPAPAEPASPAPAEPAPAPAEPAPAPAEPAPAPAPAEPAPAEPAPTPAPAAPAPGPTEPAPTTPAPNP